MTRQLAPRNTFWIAASCATLLLAGCNNRVATVDGIVTLDNKPLTHGTVTLHPAANGRTGYGTIAPDGSFSIRSGDSDGVEPGRYTVTVVSLEPSTSATGPHGMPMPGKHITPSRYSSAQSSDLHVDVVPGEQQLPLNLKSQ